jgi:hypothetical protein
VGETTPRWEMKDDSSWRAAASAYSESNWSTVDFDELVRAYE